MLSFPLALATMVATIQTATTPATPLVVSYGDAVVCAGVTQAGSELEGNESPRGRRLFDAALYWSLTTIQLGQASGRPPIQTERDMTNARIRSVRDLSQRDSRITERLETCMKSAPSLN